MNSVVGGALVGLIGVVLFTAFVMFKTGRDIFGADWRLHVASSGSMIRDRKFRIEMAKLAIWFMIHGALIGTLMLGGKWTWGVLVGLAIYVVMTVGYRQYIGGQGGRKSWPQWQKFWKIREEIPLLKATDKRAYNSFYVVGMGIGLFWAWLGIFDALVK